MILYEGPSMLNGEPIVAIATGFPGKRTENRKTGKMIQVWILCSTIDPLTASQNGSDSAICGACPHRGVGPDAKRSCYVILAQAPLAIYRAYRAGAYQPGALPSGCKVRLGAYGDPAALPVAVLRSILKGSIHRTGYTHSWRSRRVQGASTFLMASVDTYAEHKAATAMGWRTFRPLTGHMRNGANEITCPNSTHGVQCADCGLCSGANGAMSITVPAHGTPAIHIRRNLKLAGAIA